MPSIPSSSNLVTLLALPCIVHAATVSQITGLKELYARYEANFESQSICYTYFRTIPVTLESLSNLPSQQISDGFTYPATISTPSSSYEFAPGLPSVDGDSSLAFTPTQSWEFGDSSGSGQQPGASNFPPLSNTSTLQNPSLGSTAPYAVDDSATRADMSTFTNPALTTRSNVSASANSNSESAINNTGDVFTPTNFISDNPNPSLESAAAPSSDISPSLPFATRGPSSIQPQPQPSGFSSANSLSDVPNPSLGSTVVPIGATSPLATVSTVFPPQTRASESASSSIRSSVSLSSTEILPTGPILSFSTVGSASGVPGLPSPTQISGGGETATGVSPAAPTSPAGPAGSATAQGNGSSAPSIASQSANGVSGTSISPTPVDTGQPGGFSSQGSDQGSVLSGTGQSVTGGLSGGTLGAGSTAGTDSLAGGTSSAFLVPNSSARTTVGSESILMGSSPSANLPGAATSSQSGTEAATLSATSSTLDASISAESRVILSVRSEPVPVLVPTITITQEGTTSQAARRIVRRQEDPPAPANNSTAGFVGDEQLPSPNNCSNARLFIRSRGALRTEGEPLSVDPGVPYIDVANYTRGLISTRFDVIDGTLVWANPLFYGGQAGFCQVNGSSSSVYATFTAAGGPENCTDVDLVVYKGMLLGFQLVSKLEEPRLIIHRGPVPIRCACQ